MTKEIPLTKGYAALVDDEDYERLISMGSWHAAVRGHLVYAAQGRRALLMHRVIFGLVKGDKKEVDHDDRNGLNNQKDNLKVTNSSGNKKNLPKPRTNTSGVVGVRWFKPGNKWRAEIQVNGKSRHIGYFDRIEDAAAARLEVARSLGFKR